MAKNLLSHLQTNTLTEGRTFKNSFGGKLYQNGLVLRRPLENAVQARVAIRKAAEATMVDALEAIQDFFSDFPIKS